MASILPQRNITMVLPYKAQKVEEALIYKTLPADIMVPQNHKPQDNFWFKGDIAQKEFVLSLRTDSFHSYVPIINGKIEPTSSGSIVFLKYELFKSTRYFMLIWSAITLFLTFLFAFGIPRMHLSLLCILLLVSNHIIATLSFQKQVKATQDKFNRLFEHFS